MSHVWHLSGAAWALSGSGLSWKLLLRGMSSSWCWSEGIFAVPHFQAGQGLMPSPLLSPQCPFPSWGQCQPLWPRGRCEVHNLWCLPQEDACQDFAISCTA